jgi:hypothetical protein
MKVFGVSEEAKFRYFQPKPDPGDEHCICEKAHLCTVEPDECYHKRPHKLSKGSLYVHPCKLPTYCRHLNMDGIVCKTVPRVVH